MGKTQRERTKLRKEADKLVRRKILERDGRCMDEERVHRCAGPLQWTHLISRGYLAVRYDDDNSVAMCQGAHMFYTKRPLEWEDWRIAFLGQARWDALRARAKRGGIPDYEQIIADLTGDPLDA